MQTRAVNLRAEAFDIYVGRAGKGQSGYFGNPIHVARNCGRCGVFHADAGSTLPCYQAYLLERLTADAAFFHAVRALKGKRLGCFCKPGPCHADLLARAAEVLG